MELLYVYLQRLFFSNLKSQLFWWFVFDCKLYIYICIYIYIYIYIYICVYIYIHIYKDYAMLHCQVSLVAQNRQIPKKATWCNSILHTASLWNDKISSKFLIYNPNSSAGPFPKTLWVSGKRLVMVLAHQDVQPSQKTVTSTDNENSLPSYRLRWESIDFSLRVNEWEVCSGKEGSTSAAKGPWMGNKVSAGLSEWVSHLLLFHI